MELSSKHKTALKYLVRIDTPLYSLEELASYIRAFLEHLKQNRDSLLMTGFPKTMFRESFFLNHQLNALYPVKLPIRDEQSEDDQGQFVYRYTWPDKAPPTMDPFIDRNRRAQFWLPDDLARDIERAEDGSIINPCSYDNALIMVGLSEAQADRLENGRAEMYKITTELLDRLLNALYSPDGSNLWSNCLQVFMDNLTQEDIHFYLNVDNLYDKYRKELVFIINGGGLTPLIWMIEHVEREITIGRLNETRKCLRTLVKKDSNARLRLVLEQGVNALDHVESQYLHAGLDRYLKLHPQEKSFSSKFYQRVEEAFDEVIPDYEKHRKSWQKNTDMSPSSLSFQLQSRDSHITLRDTTIEINTFSKVGDCWNFVFEGIEVGQINHLKGFNFISYLLGHPDHIFTLFQLVNAVDGINSDCDQEIVEISLQATDEQAIRAIKNKLEDIEAELKLNDISMDKRTKLESEREKYKDYLKENTRLGEHSRYGNRQKENLRRNVHQNVQRAITHLGKYHKDLAEHLTECVTISLKLCAYTPPNDKKLHWN